MDDVSQGVENEGKGTKKDHEWNDAGVEQTLSGQHICKLQRTKLLPKSSSYFRANVLDVFRICMLPPRTLRTPYIQSC